MTITYYSLNSWDFKVLKYSCTHTHTHLPFNHHSQ